MLNKLTLDIAAALRVARYSAPGTSANRALQADADALAIVRVLERAFPRTFAHGEFLALCGASVARTRK